MTLHIVMPIISALVFSMSASQDQVTHDEWAPWNAVPNGAWVKMDHAVGVGSKGRRKVLTLKRIRKEGESVVVGTHMSIRGREIQGKERVLRRSPNGPAVLKSAKVECTRCGNAHVIVNILKGQKMKVKDRTISAVLVDTEIKSCAGQVTSRVRIWYSKEVPGGIVKSETTSPYGWSKMSCIDFSTGGN